MTITVKAIAAARTFSVSFENDNSFLDSLRWTPLAASHRSEALHLGSGSAYYASEFFLVVRFAPALAIASCDCETV